MQLAFLYQPVPELEPALAFYRDELGLDEAWREGDDTVAFALPGGEVQFMVSTIQDPAGPMFLVDSVADWIAAHPEVTVVKRFDIPGGSVASLTAVGGNAFYVLDQPEN